MNTLIYLDNASTSFPKPDAVYKAAGEAVRRWGGNPGRAGHRMSLDSARAILEARENVARLFNVDDASRIIFTSNATAGVNMVLKGLLSGGGHMVTTGMEHNSVMRPLSNLMRRGLEVDVVPCNDEGRLEPAAIMEAVRSDTQLIAVIHASNVVGTINPVAKIGRLARLRGIPMLVDAAQTAGAMRLDVQSDCMDIMACSGHKGLMGPQGTGVLYIDKGIDFDPLMEGGTGSDSEMLEQPLFLPDKFESGTLNTPGIVALSAAVEYIMERGVDDIREHELKLTTELLEGLKGIQRARVFGPPEARDRMPVVSFNLDGMDPAYVGQCLDDEYGIMTRVGLHCSPMAHKAMGTFPQGSVRASMGCFNSSSDVDRLLEGLSKLAVR